MATRAVVNKAPGSEPNRSRSKPHWMVPWAVTSSSGQAATLAPPKRSLEEQLASLRAEQGAVQQALFAASQLQRKLCAPRPLRRGPFDVASEIFPVRYLSGDFYHVGTQETTTAVAVGDIAGKGLVAGLWFTHLVGLLRTHAGGSAPDPGTALATINGDLCRLQPEVPMVALFLGQLDRRSSELLYSNAGQPPALLLRRDGAVEWLQEGGPPLGVVPQATFKSQQVHFRPGDLLLSYSDGIVECRNHREEEFGVERLLAAARSASRDSAHAILFSILGAVQDFSGSCAPDDDLTLLVVRRLDP